MKVSVKPRKNRSFSLLDSIAMREFGRSTLMRDGQCMYYSLTKEKMSLLSERIPDIMKVLKGRRMVPD